MILNIWIMLLIFILLIISILIIIRISIIIIITWQQNFTDVMIKVSMDISQGTWLWVPPVGITYGHQAIGG